MNQNIKNLIINPVFFNFEELNTLINSGTIKLEDAVKEVINLKKAKSILCFAFYIKGAPIRELADAIIATNDAQCIYEFAFYIKGAPIKELADAIISTQDAEYIYNFARWVKEAPIKELADAIIAINNDAYIYIFARWVKGAPIKELADAIIAINNLYYICEFAIYIKGAPIKKLADAIIATNNAQYIYTFACFVEGAPIKELADAIITTQDADCVYYFACWVKGAPIKELLKKLLVMKKNIYAYKLMPKFIHTHNSNQESINEIKSMILTTSDSSFIYKCANCFDKIYTSSFVNRLIELRDYEFLTDILINVEFGEKNLITGNVENYVVTNLDLILNIMITCHDENVINEIALKAKSPHIRECFTKLLVELKEKKTIYSYFLNIKNPLTEEDKKVIDELFEDLPEKNQKIVTDYINGVSKSATPTGKKAINFIDNLREKFKEHLETKKPENPKTTGKLKEEKTIYTYFLNIKNPLTEEDEKVIDELFKNLSEENQKIVTDYINAISKSATPTGKKAINLLNSLRQKFKDYLNKFYMQSNNYKDEHLEILLNKYESLNRYFCQILGYSVRDYLEYSRAKEKEIRNRGITAFDEVLEVFINESLEFIKELKKNRSL